LLGFGEILGCIDADGLYVADADLDLVAILKPAELFERFDLLECALWEGCDLTEHVGAVGIETDVLVVGVVWEPLFPILPTHEWDDGAGEVECLHTVVDYHLGRVDILKGWVAIGGSEWFDKCSNIDGVVGEAVAYGDELFGLDEWFIALDVDHYIVLVCTYLGECFIAAVGTTAVSGRGHYDLTSKGYDGIVDALVVGSYYGVVEHTVDLFVDTLNDWFAAKHG